MLKLFLAISLLCGIYTTSAQDCKVLKKGIDETYSGDCKRGKADGEGMARGIDTYRGSFKKGLPDGQGTYSWKNGDVYEGEWKQGEMDGKGKLTKADNSVVTGYWKKDTYEGLHEKPYEKIDKSQNVSSYTITSAKGENNSIRLYLIENQNTVRDPNANIVTHNGNYSNMVNGGNYLELLNVTFPFKAKIYFNQEFIELEIYNKGNWDVKTNVTHIKGLGNN